MKLLTDVLMGLMGAFAMIALIAGYFTNPETRQARELNRQTAAAERQEELELERQRRL